MTYDEVHNDLLNHVEKRFGYRPNEPRENWTIFNGNFLIVVDADRLPRLYRDGCHGVPIDIKPEP